MSSGCQAVEGAACASGAADTVHVLSESACSTALSISQIPQELMTQSPDIKFELSNKINLELIAVGSEGDVSQRLCESRGFFYVEYENVPLNRKYNAACRTAKQFDPDAVFRIDSDDWITGNKFDRYLEILKNGVDVVGLSDIYFFGTG